MFFYVPLPILRHLLQSPCEKMSKGLDTRCKGRKRSLKNITFGNSKSEENVNCLSTINRISGVGDFFIVISFFYYALVPRPLTLLVQAVTVVGLLASVCVCVFCSRIPWNVNAYRRLLRVFISAR